MKKLFLILSSIFIGIFVVLYLNITKKVDVDDIIDYRVFDDSSFVVKKEILINKGYSKILSVTDSNIILLNNDFKSLSIINNENSINLFKPSEIFENVNVDFINDVSIEKDNNIFFIGNSNKIFYCNALDNNAFAKLLNLNFNYSKPIKLISGNYILRKSDFNSENLIFIKYNQELNKISDSAYIFNKLNDAGMSIDGFLGYNNSDRLYYINYYNSDAYIFDTTFKNVKKISTIDSTKKLPKVYYNPIKKTYKFSEPNEVINNAVAVNKYYIVVNSTKLSKTSMQKSKGYNCMDIYNSDGVYLRSNGLNKKYGNEIIDMKFIGNEELYILTEKQLVIININ